MSEIAYKEIMAALNKLEKTILDAAEKIEAEMASQQKAA